MSFIYKKFRKAGARIHLGSMHWMTGRWGRINRLYIFKASQQYNGSIVIFAGNTSMDFPGVGPGSGIWGGIGGPVGLGWGRGLWDLLLRPLWLLLPGFDFWWGAGGWAMPPPRFGIFSNISLFVMSFFFLCGQSPPSGGKSFSYSWGNSYTKFATVGITYRFTCGSSDLYQNIVKFQNIMNKIVELP